MEEEESMPLHPTSFRGVTEKPTVAAFGFKAFRLTLTILIFSYFPLFVFPLNFFS